MIHKEVLVKRVMGTQFESIVMDKRFDKQENIRKMSLKRILEYWNAHIVSFFTFLGPF